MKKNESGKTNFYGWTAVGVSALAFSIQMGVVVFPFGVFLPLICEEFSWSRGAVSGAFSVSCATMGLMGPVAAIFISKYGARKMIVFGNILCVLGLFLLAFHKTIWQFYLLFGILIGAGSGFGGLLATTTIANNWFIKKRSLALGIVIASSGVMGMILVPTAQVIIEKMGWRNTYLILSAVAFVLCVIIPCILVKNKPEELGQVPDGKDIQAVSTPVSETSTQKLYEAPVNFSLKESIQTWALWLVVMVGITNAFCTSMVLAHMVAFLIEKSIGAGLAAMAMGLFAGAGAAGKLGAGFMGLKFNSRPIMIITMALMAAGLVLVQITGYLPLVFIALAMIGVGYGAVIVSATSIIPAYFGPDNFPKIYGFAMPFWAVIGPVGAISGGLIYDLKSSYASAFMVAAAVLMAGLILAFLVKPPRHPSLLHTSQQPQFSKI